MKARENRVCVSSFYTTAAAKLEPLEGDIGIPLFSEVNLGLVGGGLGLGLELIGGP